MKRVLTIVLSLVMIVASCFATVSAETEVNTAVDITMQEGAALRLNEVNGIRFYTVVDEETEEQINNLIKAGYEVEMGTLIYPKGLLGSNELTHELGDNILDVKYQARNSDGTVSYFEDGTGFRGFVGSVVNIKLKYTNYSYDNGNKGRYFVARGYVKVTGADSEPVYSYANYYDNNINNNSRTLANLAKSYMADSTGGYSELSDEQKALVQSWTSLEYWTPAY